MKEDLTLEEVSGHAIDVVGAGVDTVRLIIVIILMIMVMIMIIEKKSKFKDLGLETYILWQMVENIKKV